MGNSEIAVSSEQLTYIFLFLVYASVILISYWKLVPRLSPTAQRIASGFLAAQALVIVVSLEISPSSKFERWLWDIDKELNIPSILASTQLALVGCVALTTAWLTRARSAWQCLYLLGVGLVFLYLGMDEFVSWKDLMENAWKDLYKLAGAAITATTVTIAIRSAKHTRIWHLCLLIGLALAAMGGLVIDDSPCICGLLQILHIDGYLRPYFLEEGLELLGIWLALAAMLGHFSDVSPAVRVQRFLYALPAFWILLLAQSAAILPFQLLVTHNKLTTVTVEFETDVHLHGFHIERRSGYLDLYFSVRRWDFNGLGYSIHLVDQVSGETIATRSERAYPQHGLWALEHGLWALGSAYASIYRQRMELEISPEISNRVIRVVLTVWREKQGEFVRQKVLSPQRRLGDTQVSLKRLVFPAASPATPPGVLLARFDNGFTLDAVDIPGHALAGEILIIPFTWRSDVRGREDYVQFLHFRHEESGAWWAYGQRPLGPRLPTDRWHIGLADSETWQVPLPADLAPGHYAIYTGLYRSRDLERVSVSDTDGTPFLDARVPLGSLTIEQ